MERLDILKQKLKAYFLWHASSHKRAKNIKEIEQYLGVDNRTARRLINQIRKEGVAIVSLSRDEVTGYFLLDIRDREDIRYAEHFIAETKSRIKELEKIIAPVEKALKRSPFYIKPGEQLKLFGGMKND